MSKYQTGQLEHAAGVYSFQVNNADNVGHITACHMGWEIVFGEKKCSQGAEIGIRNKRHSLSNEQSVLVYNGEEEHQEFFHKRELSAHALVIASPFIDSLTGEYFKSSDLNFRSPLCQDHSFVQFSRSIYSSLRSDGFSINEINGTAEALVYEMIDSLAHDRDIKALSQSSLICTKMLYKEIILKLHENLANPDINLDHISAELGVTKFHIIRTTKRFGGFTPHSYLTSIRLMRAKELLLSSSFQVADVASRSGFDDLSTFGKSFKRFYGVAPTVFSRLHRKP